MMLRHFTRGILAGGLALILVAVGTAVGVSPARAFTLVIGSDLRGWDASILPIHYNPQNCSVTQQQLEAAIDAAVALWNSVPMSGIRLERGRISTSSSADFDVDLSSEPPRILDSPVILCSSDFGFESGLDDEEGTGGIRDLVPALVRPASIDGRLVYAPMLLNGSGGAADIENFSAEQLSIIIAHELGHVLGLGHAADPAALMYFNISGKTTLALSRDDAEGVAYLYPRQEPFAGEFFGCGTTAAVSGGHGGSGRSGGSGASGRPGPSGGSWHNERAPRVTVLHSGGAPFLSGALMSWLALLLVCFLISRVRTPRLRDPSGSFSFGG